LQRTAVSLFAGIGGFEIALENNGFDVVASVEIDKSCQSVLSKHFPKATIFGDVTKVNGHELISAGFVPDGGVIVGGFPCQDLSIGGQRKGLAGERSGLFWEITRLAEETQAEWLIIENVPGLLSSQRGRDMGIVLGTLANLGYSCAWRVLDAQYFGVPQRRRRCFFVAHRTGNPTGPAKVLFERTSLRGDNSTSGGEGSRPSSDLGASLAIASERRAYGQSGYGDYSEGVKTLSNSMYKRPEDTIIIEPYILQGSLAGRTNASGPDGKGYLEPGDATYTLNRSDVPIVAGGEIPVLMVMRQGKPGGGKGPLISEDVSLTLQSSSKQTLIHRKTVRRLTPLECERLQGFPDGWTEGQSDTKRYEQLGNAVAVPVVDWIIRGLVEAMEDA
jgi:DNA (cytosine-5)-methyltransferase 1